MWALVAVLLTATPNEDITVARKAGHTQRFAWVEWNAEAFARAKREKKVVLVDCAAEWCHWCHVMDETTYADPDVGAWLAKNAVAVRVDIDARPDLADRYLEWGWPATVLLTGDGEELGKFRGYLPPEQLLGILKSLNTAAPMKPVDEPIGTRIDAKYARERLENFYDEKEGSWGLKRKVPIAMNVLWELEAGSKERATFTLEKQRALLDPVWGGIYQYSAAADWNSPHFEKLISFQGLNLEAYARAGMTDEARGIHRFLTTFMRSKDGTYFTNQDADLNAHDKSKPFMDGAKFYALDDAKRRALGTPWIDTHIYAGENGQVISGLVAFGALDDARRAADQLAKTHVLPDGTVKHEASSKGRTYLTDAALLGLAYARLGKATGDAKYVELSQRIAKRMVAAFDSPEGLLYDVTVDADSVGVFSRRPHAFAPNVSAARLLAAVGDKARGRRLLTALSAKQRLDDERAWLGDYLLAARELDSL
ncbi:MAG: DUF255 domain-containing protein [Archangium sp.]